MSKKDFDLNKGAHNKKRSKDRNKKIKSNNYYTYQCDVGQHTNEDNSHIVETGQLIRSTYVDMHLFKKFIL